MSLAIMYAGDRGIPVLVCDACGKKIETPNDCNVVWTDDGKWQDGAIFPVRTYHKDCDPESEEDQPWEEGGRYIPWLLCNMKAGKLRQRGEQVKITVDVPEMLYFL